MWITTLSDALTVKIYWIYILEKNFLSLHKCDCKQIAVQIKYWLFAILIMLGSSDLLPKSYDTPALYLPDDFKKAFRY